MGTAREPKRDCTRGSCQWPHCDCRRDEYPHGRDITAAPKGDAEPLAPGCYRCRPAHQQGFETIQLAMWIALLLIIGGALWGGNAWLNGVKKDAYARGVIDTKVAAEEDRKRRDHAVAGALDTLAKAAGKAQAEADKHKANWQEARNEAKRSGKPLGSCQNPGPVEKPGAVAGAPAGSDPGQAGLADRSPGVHLHWRFVGLHDSAFTGSDGKPLFDAQAQYAAAPERSDTPSPYTLDDLIDIDAGDNFVKYSKCRKDLNDAIDKVEAAEAAYERGKK